MAFSKKTRQQVFDKYNGHCGYCGYEFKSISEMQVDHIHSKLKSRFKGEEVDNSLENLMPSCRQCNFYKNAAGIESFRRDILKTLSNTCRKSFQVRLAMKYGMLTFHPWDGKFYFEKVEEKSDDHS